MFVQSYAYHVYHIAIIRRLAAFIQGRLLLCSPVVAIQVQLQFEVQQEFEEIQ